MNRIKYRRTRVCLRPDFLAKLPMAADVKTITLGHLDVQGPISRKLREYGEVLPLCFCIHGEASREVHKK